MKLLWIFFILVGLLLSGCGTSTGTYGVSLSFDSFNARNLQAFPSFDMRKLQEARDVTSLTMCFKRLRFKTQGEGTSSDTSEDEDNVDFQIGEKSISGSGTTLGNITLPAGTYTRVEFDLEDDGQGCSSGNSVSLTNGSGSFSTDDRITVKFDGTFTLSNTDATLALGLQSIIDALDTVTSDEDSDTGIKAKTESANGSL